MKQGDIEKMVIENSKTLGRVEQKQDDMIRRFDKFEKRMMIEFKDFKNNYVTKAQFNITMKPIQKIVYGLVGIILTAITYSGLLYLIK